MLSAEEKGVLCILLDLMYERRSAIPDEPSKLARTCGCTTRRFNQIKRTLAETHHKLLLKDGLITNRRAEQQIVVEEKEHDKSAEIGSKGGVKSGENRSKGSRKSVQNRAGSNKNNDLAKIPLDEKSELTRASLPEPDITPPTPQGGGTNLGRSGNEVMRRCTSKRSSRH
jgi:uncharacterized protein YdaU (DUF1376 family)